MAFRVEEDIGEEIMTSTDVSETRQEQKDISQERKFINDVWERIDGDRRAIATLSRCLNRQPYYQKQAAQYVYPNIPDDIWRYPKTIERYVFVTALMASNYKPDVVNDESGDSFGKTCRKLQQALHQKAGTKSDDKKMDGIDRRFQALLNANGEEVYRYIEMLTPLLRQHQISCDWAKLLEDLDWWDHANEKTRLRWASDYYSNKKD